MRMLTVSIVIGPLVLIGALPAARSVDFRARLGRPVQLAAVGDSTADRDTYTQRARDEMQEWQRKLHDFSEIAGGQRGKKQATRPRMI